MVESLQLFDIGAVVHFATPPQRYDHISESPNKFDKNFQNVVAIVKTVKKLALRNVHFVSLQSSIMGLTGFDSVQKWSVSMQSNDAHAL